MSLSKMGSSHEVSQALKRRKTLSAQVRDSRVSSACEVLANWLSNKADQSPMAMTPADDDAPVSPVDNENLVDVTALLGKLLRAHLAPDDRIATIFRRVLHPEPTVRLEAMNQLDALAPSRVLPFARSVLVPLLLKIKSNARPAAVLVIARLCYRFTTTPPFLLSALVQVMSSRQDVYLAVKTLRELAPPAFIHAHLEEIAACLAYDPSTADILFAMLVTQTTEALAPHAECIVTFLMTSKISQDVVLVLGRLPKALVVPHLVSLLSNVKEQTRGAVITMLKRMPDEILSPHLPDIIDLLTAPQRCARASAQALLQSITTRGPLLLPHMDRLVGMAIDPIVNDYYAGHVLAASRAGDLSPHLSPIFTLLRSTRSDATARAKIVALRTLLLLKPILVKPHATDLFRHLEDPNLDVQLWTLRVLLKAGIFKNHLEPILRVRPSVSGVGAGG